MDNQAKSDCKLCNQQLLRCFAIMDFLLVFCYLVEVFLGNRSWTYYLIYLPFALFPLIVPFIMYKKDNYDDRIRYVFTISFNIYYTFVLFTTHSSIAYIYAIIATTLILAYNDFKLITINLGMVIIINIAQIIYIFARYGYHSQEIADIEIRLASVALFCIFTLKSCMVIVQNYNNKIIDLKNAKNSTERLTTEIIDVSDKLVADIGLVSDKMRQLETSAVKTMTSMENVANGTNDTAESIQIQLEKTEDISYAIEHVEESSKEINETIGITREELSKAQKNIDSLLEHVNTSAKGNVNVSEELTELNEHTTQMQSIINMIDEITTQTSLLALNASIEAARAGEAGKGFSVVASEISKLATQTQSATDNITELIENISVELSKVVSVIEEMIENIDAQNQAANETVASFKAINKATNEVYAKSTELNNLMDGLTEANHAIIEGIETISAATQEVTAHSQETYRISEQNSNITTEVSDIITGLNEMANKLQIS
ncbi:MAG: hypothetical protein K6F77_06490 [Lachnospiraceae bacterium]|nr:hypothetical protein [Lachnospiraceae bacterium]